jgi:TM2 domain-containing membrane protein YozV
MKSRITASIIILTIFLSSCAKETYFFSKTGAGTTYGNNKKAPAETLATPEKATAEALVSQPATETKVVYSASANKAVAVSKKQLTQAKALYHGTVATPKKEVSKVAQIKAAVKLNKEIKSIVKEAEANNMPADQAEGKSQLIALILAFLVGAIGIHRFYLGYTGIGIAQLLTLGGCGIWALIDLIRIITGDLKPKDGDYTTKL